MSFALTNSVFDSHFFPLLVTNQGRSGSQRVRARYALRKRDGVSNRRFVAKKRQQSIQTDCKAAVGRTSVLQGVQEMTELQ